MGERGERGCHDMYSFARAVAFQRLLFIFTNRTR